MGRAWAIEPLTAATVDRELSVLQTLDAGMPGEAWTPAHWRLDLPGKWRWSRVARADGELLGFLVASERMGAVHVHRLAVAHAARRRGVARALVLDLARAVVAGGAGELTLKVHPDNLPARQLYAALGFSVAAEEPTTLVMRASPSAVLARDRSGDSDFSGRNQV
jgi:ribosomal protein S18 acetylase RimI-like enzyme